jgi:glycerol-3-phosphate acyltransferase PlsX
VRLILDVMGGDHGPHALIEGAVKALPELQVKGTELVLLGDEAQIRATLSQRRLRPLLDAIEQTRDVKNGHRVSILHASDAIGMEDSIRAIRTKPEATINVGCRMAAESYAPAAQEQENWKPTAFISAGHSGAMMASALMHMGRLTGAERPAIAVKLPTMSIDGCVLLDVGANVDCKPEYIRDFAVMGALFAQVERKSGELPRVGILSNGEERSKGNELTRAALALIDPLPCFAEGSPGAVGKFVGYSEGKEIFKGSVDVVVTDGFVGNVVLKSLEGLGSAVVTTLKREAKSSLLTPLGFLLAAAAFRRLKRKLDYAEYGAAPLLGVAGYAFICHGRSNPRAIKNALLRARTALEERLVERMESALKTKGA